MKKAVISLNSQALDKAIYETVCRLHDDGRYLIPSGGNNSTKLPYPSPCYTCGGKEYWATSWGGYTCSRCHSQPREDNQLPLK
ncbi:hypothetical protein ACFLYB_06395 [Chloroflexota bacterium]